ncbi:MAG: gliding motility protein GldN [Muribaculaceae bacterium]|nr:gliding motility protein GldN [Muribaculaceae bacterium]
MMLINNKTLAYTLLFLLSGAGAMSAQNNIRSSATEVTRNAMVNHAPARRTVADENKNTTAVKSDAPSSDVGWMRVIYRHLDLDNEKNAALYYPEMPVGGQENLFRIIMRLIAGGKIKAYEYLDGREVFTPEFQVQTDEMLARFHIPYTESNNRDRNGLVIEENDLPAADVMSYYVLEQWEFDNVKSHTVNRVLALCPVLHQTGEFGDELKYPMFWVEMDDLHPYLADTAIFVDDSDNTPRYSYNDFFTLALYEGDIYKTRNVRNKSMAQIYPDETARKQASDSIQNRLTGFDKALWSPSREELQEARQAKEELEAKQPSVKREIRQSRRSTRARGTKPAGTSGSNSAVRSVRDRK